VSNVRAPCGDGKPTVLPAGAAFSCGREDATEMFAAMGLQYCQSQTECLTHEGVMEQAWAWPEPLQKAELCFLHCTAVIRERRGEAVFENL